MSNKIAELEEKLKKIEKGSQLDMIKNNPVLLADANKKIASLKKQIEDEKKISDYSDKKKEPKKAKEPKVKPAKEPKKIMFEGKEISEADADYCEKLLQAFYKNRENRNKSSKKSKNKPPLQKAGEQIGDGVSNVVDGVKKDPSGSGDTIVAKILIFVERALSSSKNIPDDKKKMVRDALDIIKELLKEYK